VKSAVFRALAAFALIGSSVVHLSCNVNEYCLNCAKGGDGGTDDSLDADDGGNGDADDGGDGGPCINSGPEVCDNKDNDCDGNVDEGALPTIGEPCSNQMGECAGGIKQCTAGVVTCSKPPKPEICDLKDNDCNGVPDDGDPGGGAVCGTSVGECVAGTNHCVSGSIQCVGSVGTVGGQPETCNNRDDDCDGKFDEGIGVIGSCPTGTNTGECNIGNLMCVGGTPTCVGAIGPSPELCDTLDQDCDGNPTNGFNLNTDPQNCGACGMVCNLSAQHAFAGCGGNPAKCTVAACQAGYYDNNGVVADGCEYGGGTCFITGPEVCDGVDNDCNAATNETTLTPPSNLCLNAGECFNAHTAACTGGSFKCTYTDPDVTQTGGVIQPETLCDGKDNDCDGKIDEGQPNLGLPCDNGLQGVCRSSGNYQCNSMNLNGPAVCVYSTVGTAPATEVCDGKDNNCNGTIDDGAATGNLGNQVWVTIPGTSTQIMKYEAARPDATGTADGTQTTHACSQSGLKPWTNIKYPDAVAVCAASGGRLCTENEWQSMCAQPVAPTYPLAGPSGTIGSQSDYVFVEAENAFANATVGGKTWTVAPIQNYSGTTALRSLPDSGSNPTAANAPTQSARLDFQMSLTGGTGYYVWTRMFSADGNADTIYVGISATQPGTAVNTTIVTPINNQWLWVRSSLITPATTGNYFVSIYQKEDGSYVDAIAVTRDGDHTPPFDEKIWATQNGPKYPQPQICNDDEYDTNPVATGDQDDILPTGSMLQCFANGAGTADAYDMSGNVREWTAARAAGQNPIRGGSSNTSVTGTTCGLNFTLANDTFFFPNVGFRCCR